MGYKRTTESTYYSLVNDKGKVLYAGTMIQISKEYHVSRNAVYQILYGKYKMFGEYTIRIATEQEVEKWNMVRDFKEKERIRLQNQPQKKVHVPQPYRSSSARRFTPL